MKTSCMYYLAGCDGTGKTTQVRLLCQRLRAGGVRVLHLWLRFPFFLSLPLLGYARWKGFSWQERNRDVRIGYWDFVHSKMLVHLLPWTMLLDAYIATFLRVSIPIALGYVLVCDRFVLDMLVDLALGCGKDDLYLSLPGRWFNKLIPESARIVILDLDSASIQARRPDLAIDRSLPKRLDLYRRMGEAWEIPIISSKHTVSVMYEIISDIFFSAQ